MQPLNLLLIAVAGGGNRQQQMVTDYFIQVSRVLKEQLEGQRFRFNDDLRTLLAVKAKVLGHQALDKLEALVAELYSIHLVFLL